MRKGDENATWIVVKVAGATPGKRYGHTLSFSKPYLILFGGHIDSEPLNDTWVLSIEKVPFAWEKIEIKSDIPAARAYHSAAVCGLGAATGMVVIFGGRGTDQNPRNDAWGLRRHRNGSWEWVKAPYKGAKAPTPRYQVKTYNVIYSIVRCSIMRSCWLLVEETTMLANF